MISRIMDKMLIAIYKGLDIPHVNFDIPTHSKDYIHPHTPRWQQVNSETRPRMDMTPGRDNRREESGEKDCDDDVVEEGLPTKSVRVQRGNLTQTSMNRAGVLDMSLHLVIPSPSSSQKKVHKFSSDILSMRALKHHRATCNTSHLDPQRPAGQQHRPYDMLECAKRLHKFATEA